MAVARRALILGGGGVTGIAWETGLLAGLAQAGVDLMSADVVVGTSAGSVVGAQLLSGVPLEDLYEEQLKDASGEIAAKMGARAMAWFIIGSLWPGDERLGRARLGRAALKARTVPESVRRAVIEQRLPNHSWPDRRLLITAVDAATGEAKVFDREGDVPLPVAVAASWPSRWSGPRSASTGVASSMAGCDRLPTPTLQVAAIGWLCWLRSLTLSAAPSESMLSSRLWARMCNRW